MEFAFSALVLLILLLPGFIFQTTFTKGLWRWNSPTSNRPLTEQIPRNIGWASGLHLLWIMLAFFLDSPVNLGTVIMFVSGNYGHDEEYFSDALKSVVEHQWEIVLYFSTLYAFSALIGYATHKIIRECKLDKKTRFFRFNNEWFYYLTSEVNEFKESAKMDNLKIGEKITQTYLTAIVHHSEKDYIYQGYIYDFFFDSNGSLDRIILKDVKRRELSNDELLEEDYFTVLGEYFILRYSEMSTINLYFVEFEKIGDDPTADETDVRILDNQN